MKKRSQTKPGATKLRVIGGTLRGSLVTYHGEKYTRPMRDSVRENLFNILGTACRGAIAFDLFAGTGVLAIEAISRGATTAVAIESARPAHREIAVTLERLKLTDRVTLLAGDAFQIANDILRSPVEAPDTPWLLFLSPPYAMWTQSTTQQQLIAMVERAQRDAPPGSVVVVETDHHFDCDLLPEGQWDVRRYGVTQLAFLEPANVCGMQASDLNWG